MYVYTYVYIYIYTYMYGMCKHVCVYTRTMFADHRSRTNLHEAPFRDRDIRMARIRDDPRVPYIIRPISLLTLHPTNIA